MILAALLALITWDRVLTQGCFGDPEASGVVSYRMLAAVRVVGPTSCTDAAGQAATCPGTIPAPSVEFLPSIPDPGTGTSVATTADPVANPDLLPSCSPAPCLTAWPWGEFARAYDRAGNWSGACP